IQLRAGSDRFGKVLTEDRRGSEAHLGCDSLDRKVARLEQLLRSPNASTCYPSGRRRSNLLSKPAAQGSSAHRGLPGDRREREIAAQVLLEPGQELAQGDAVRLGRLVNDELRLPP